MNNTLQLVTPAGGNLQPVAPVAAPPVELFDRYADSIIGCFAHQYDAVQVHGVRNFASGTDDGTCYEIDNVAPTSFSVYVHLKDGGLDCVGDFSDYDDAYKYAGEISSAYEWPVTSFVPTEIRDSKRKKLQ